MISIGSNVRLNKNLTILTYDGGYYVLLNKYREFVSQSGKVEIGIMFISAEIAVFKGVTTGDNCIIGYGMLSRKAFLPIRCSCSPVKVISSVEDTS